MEEHRPKRLLDQVHEVLHQDLGPVDALRAKRPKRLPTVLTKDVSSTGVAWLSAAPWIQQLPGIDLGTDSHRHVVLNWQRKRVRIWRCDSPILLSEAAPVQFPKGPRMHAMSPPWRG